MMIEKLTDGNMTVIDYATKYNSGKTAIFAKPFVTPFPLKNHD